MRATLARLELVPPDWSQVGGWLAAAATAAIGIYAGFKRDWKGVGSPSPKVPGGPSKGDDSDLAVKTLERLIQTMTIENERLWKRIEELERRDGERDRQGDARDVREQDQRVETGRLRMEISRLRAKLVQAGIDPGSGDG